MSGKSPRAAGGIRICAVHGMEENKSDMFEEEWAKKTKLVDEMITTYLPKEEGPQRTVTGAVNYSVRAGGKRLRPLLLVESNLFCGGAGLADPLVCAFAAALEMIHTYSLVHDDLPAMDNDMYRRGKLTTHAKYGEAMGILAGDALLNGAFETAAAALCEEGDPERLFAGTKALLVLAQKSGMYGMLGGQAVDVEKTGEQMDAAELDFVYRLKTGALLEAAFMAGAILAGAPGEKIRALSQVAALTGMAFQIKDDILDVTGDEKELGKPVHSDEKNRKSTYVTMYSMEQAKAKVAELSGQAGKILSGLSGDGAFLQALIAALTSRRF